MPRYVILEHDHPCLHWDLMLEAGDRLRTWRLARLPEVGANIAATYIFQHRKLYLDYEGPVSGNRGRVRRWDGGTYVLVSETAGELICELAGERLRGQAHLKHHSAEHWEFQIESVTRGDL